MEVRHCGAVPRSINCRVIELFGRYNLANTGDPQGHKMQVIHCPHTARPSSRFSRQGMIPQGRASLTRLRRAASRGVLRTTATVMAMLLERLGDRVEYPLASRYCACGSLDVLEALAAIPQQRVAQIQATIRRRIGCSTRSTSVVEMLSRFFSRIYAVLFTVA